MILVSQGHENSIGLEVFFKSILMLPAASATKFKLFGNQSTIEKHLENLRIKYSVSDSQIRLGDRHVIPFQLLKSQMNVPESTVSLAAILESIDAERDILFTLPTSKDQLIYKGNQLNGHTEFFRQFFNSQDISMTFLSSNNELILLLTDHIPLNKVSTVVDTELISRKTSTTLAGLKKYFYSISEVVFAGINPHAGEDGLIGEEEQQFSGALTNLKNKFPNVNFVGPLPGDTMHTAFNSKINQLKAYSYHDQGLNWFKQKHHFISANISFGLPFLRISVSHGTAFELYNKNVANQLGSLFCLNLCLKAHKKLEKKYEQ